MPLRYLSVTSLIGVLSSVVIVAILLFDGCYKKEAPGSLHEPVLTHAGPHWSVLPSSFGILMSGYSAHAVFPSLYRDMRSTSSRARFHLASARLTSPAQTRSTSHQW